MKQYPRLSRFSAIILTSSLLLASTMSYAYKNYKGEDYKGEVVVRPLSTCCLMKELNDGIYIGLGLGYDSYRIRQNLGVTDIDGGLDQANPAIGARGVLGSVFAGYGQYFNWFYIAGEIFTNYSGAATSYSLNSYHSNFSARGSYGLGILPGLRLSVASLLYARLGFIRTSFQAQENGFSGPALNTTNWGNGFNYGLGMETVIYDKFSLRGEYTYTSYSSFSSAVGTKFSPTNTEFVMGLIYHFDYI